MFLFLVKFSEFRNKFVLTIDHITIIIIYNILLQIFIRVLKLEGIQISAFLLNVYSVTRYDKSQMQQNLAFSNLIFQSLHHT